MYFWQVLHKFIRELFYVSLSLLVLMIVYNIFVGYFFLYSTSTFLLQIFWSGVFVHYLYNLELRMQRFEESLQDKVDVCIVCNTADFESNIKDAKEGS